MSEKKTEGLSSRRDPSKNAKEHLIIGAIKSLEKRLGVCDIALSDRSPSDKHEIMNWEQKNSCIMPDDLKQFYLYSDGILLKWSSKVSDSKVQIGRMEINSLVHLLRLSDSNSKKENPCLIDLNSEDDEKDSQGHLKPNFDNRSRIFELDPCEGNGKVCLVYTDTKVGVPATKCEIWFLDRAIRWHFLAESFVAYYRLMVMHLGLPQWQYIFTDIGLSPQAKQWFHLYAPMRLEVDHNNFDSEISSSPNNGSSSQLDIGKVFKGKTDKKKPSTSAQGSRSKKPSQTGTSTRSSAPNANTRLR